MGYHYLFLTIGLLGYGLKRYNGYDLDSYFKLAEGVKSGLALYGDPPLSLYPPSGAYLLELLQFIPKSATHPTWYCLSILIFYRLSKIAFALFPTAKPKVKQIGFYWLSWLGILQGLGAQLEGGNINLLLMYLMIEGFNLLFKSASDQKRVLLGLFLCWLPVMFKPYLGLISCGLTLFCLRRYSWKVGIAPVLVGLMMTIVPALFKGPGAVFADYSNWLSGDVSYIDCAFTLKCNAVNYG
ncbi:MAG: glycosyltransferase 87 family protein, partial [Pseudomonadota bacterium]